MTSTLGLFAAEVMLSTVANATRSAPAHAAAPAAAAGNRRLSRACRKPARDPFHRRCLFVCRSRKNPLHLGRSGNHPAAKVLRRVLTLARAFVRRSRATVPAPAAAVSNTIAGSAAALRPAAVSPAPTLVRTHFPVPSQSPQPNPALNLAPFGRWTLRDEAAQRRLALR